MNYTYGYARVSTREQQLDTQLDALQKAGCDRVVQEKASGAVTTRPQLDKLLEQLREGDTLMVARFNRLGRNTRHLLEVLAQLSERGVRFVALDLGVDTATPSGQLVTTIFAALAEYQRAEILEKTSHGRELAKEKGTHMGRKPGLDAKKLDKVRRAMDAGMGAAETATLTGLSLATVKRYRSQLREPKP